MAGGLAPAAGAQPADDDAIIIVAPQARGDSILVSFSTPRAVTPAVEQAIASGLPTTFTYDVELRRPSTFWFDKLVDSARIAVTVRFDPLTRRYHVMLLQDGRVAEERTTDKVEDMRRWVSSFERLPLFTTRELQEHTAYQRADHGPGREAGDPHADGELALVLVVEHVADQGHGGRRQRRAGDAEQRPHRDQQPRIICGAIGIRFIT